MGDLFKMTKILWLTSEPAFHLFCTNSLQHSACAPERTQDITSSLRCNTSILWASLRIGKLSAFFQLGTTSLKPVHMPRSCGKQPLETAFYHLETKTSNITRRRGGYNFLNEKKGKNSSATCWINKIRTEMCRENSLLRQERKKRKRLPWNILLFTVIQLAKENMSLHRLILYLCCRRFQSQPSAVPQLHPSFLKRAELGTVSHGCHWAAWPWGCWGVFCEAKVLPMWEGFTTLNSTIKSILLQQNSII